MDHNEHRTLAASTYNDCWTLLELSERSADDNAALMTAAFTSRYHWRVVGGPQEWAISDWMVSRASAATGYGQMSVDYALRAFHASEGLPDWAIASSAEGLARAYAAIGDLERRDEWIKRASDLVAAIVDDEDRTLIADQLASVPR